MSTHTHTHRLCTRFVRIYLFILYYIAKLSLGLVSVVTESPPKYATTARESTWNGTPRRPVVVGDRRRLSNALYLDLCKIRGSLTGDNLCGTRCNLFIIIFSFFFTFVFYTYFYIFLNFNGM